MIPDHQFVIFQNKKEAETSAFTQNFRLLSPTFLSGFEPLAFRLGGGRSILLSYRNNCNIPIIRKNALIVKGVFAFYAFSFSSP